MPVTVNEPEHCDQCGSTLEYDSTATGCLNCLIEGGLGPGDFGSRRFHHYEVCLLDDGISPRELGRGAMGITYEAIDLNLDSPVALKMISDRHAQDVGTRERFRREARAAAKLRHPNIASVFHFGETEAGQCFYAMELVEGETLERRIKRTGPMPVLLALDISMQITRALVAAEAQGLVHRDLKPSNVMLVNDDGSRADSFIVKVIDFGLAKAVVPGHGESSPLHYSFSGTPAFASPEQFNHDQNSIDGRSDIYSLGATLWYLLTGRAPFGGEELPADIHERQLHHPLPVRQLAVVNVPAPIVTLLRSMLAADPGQRPQTARQLLAALQNASEQAKEAPRRRNRLALAALTLALVILSAFGITSYLSHQQHTVAATMPGKSIAVLPLENLSSDKENSYFADGLQDDILTSLGKISDLKVISRTSVSQYHGRGVGQNLREIARALGVEHILEGSIRRVGNRVLVNVQLIDTRNDHPIWAERYDRTLADSLGLQGELAAQIAAALRASMAPEEKARLQAKPTENPEAYALYLKARGREGSINKSTEELIAADQLYGQAIGLDPKFALAHARLSIVNSHIAAWPGDDPARRAKARSAADEAMRLLPSLGECHTALGLCLYWADKDYAGALQEFSLAVATSPNEPDILNYIAGIYRRQGRWRESLASFRRSQDLDPRNQRTMVAAAANHLMVRDWPGATACYNRALEIAPDSAHAKIGLAYLEVFRNGNPIMGRKILQTIPAGIDPDGLVSAARWDLAMMERDYVAAEKILTEFPLEDFPRRGDAPKTFHQGRIALARRDNESAQRYFAAAKPDIEEWMHEDPDDPDRHAQLGVLYACMHRKEDAVREALRAVELEPESRNAFHGSNYVANLALVYALVNDSQQTNTLIERLLSTPGPVQWPDFPTNMTLADLRLRWEWDSLRTDPRFQRILAGPEPKTVVE